ncbi:MAG TPA: di-trans,poly-cis-decaprenylcistransferase [Halobacteriales archaeon]|jgi:tritrans,polycis-undecaprenyl-diphosphate synthase [geranylgeranyl-diphosphate specific]|nr:di-trans,poly-cis-decaprenylcistransferase [Halobacteriales archaeon]|tara:strand:+ start:25858 stop:26799 length:942 start_codon:yes stop_codon:yes gene_type:complete
MLSFLRRKLENFYEDLLQSEIKKPPKHVAIIQDGNRRYAQKFGIEREEGHIEGAKTTERVLHWCKEIGVEELTLYTFSTENFDRSGREQKELFDLIELKLKQFSEMEEEYSRDVRVRVIGQLERVPERIRKVAREIERDTRGNTKFKLNIALAYGGRDEMLDAAIEIAEEVASKKISIEEIDGKMIESRLSKQNIRDVDLIIRTGGDVRTSNFLPWHANGNEAAVFFCTPYWPGFSKIDFLRGIRTYEHRESTWQTTRAERAMAIIKVMKMAEIKDVKKVANRLRAYIPEKVLEEIVSEVDQENRGSIKYNEK